MKDKVRLSGECLWEYALFEERKNTWQHPAVRRAHIYLPDLRVYRYEF